MPVIGATTLGLDVLPSRGGEGPGGEEGGGVDGGALGGEEEGGLPWCLAHQLARERHPAHSLHCNSRPLQQQRFVDKQGQSVHNTARTYSENSPADETALC